MVLECKCHKGRLSPQRAHHIASTLNISSTYSRPDSDLANGAGGNGVSFLSLTVSAKINRGSHYSVGNTQGHSSRVCFWF